MKADELRHAARAFTGLELRTETFSLGSPGPERPEPEGPQPEGPEPNVVLYAVTEHTSGLRLLQPAASGEAPVFQVLPAAEPHYAAERDPSDPRVTQRLVLAADDLGCVTLAAAVIRPRRVIPAGTPPELAAAQRELTVTCTAGARRPPSVPRAGVHGCTRAAVLR
ncbi:toxin TcdB middle/C-terminal domain-containing protein [Streptodolium elevatio]|uniref:Toxin TcdB middle/C-terminal domain-containing protein n=1 Tax=Streptodolium elevatio TaxID=3157996 RepID=A0ABV3DIK5_9ACTN